MFSNNPRHNCLASYNSGACVLLRRADIILRAYHHNIGSHSFQSSLHGNHSRSVPTPLIHDRADMGHGKIGAAAVFQMERLALVESSNCLSYE
jgi:hypothetical protein